MPIYEYKCSSCGHKREVLQKMSDAPLTECPACGKPTLTKLISAAGFQLKGSGWYATDFKGGGSKVAKPGKEKADGSAQGEGKPGDASKAGSESNAKSDGPPRQDGKAKEEVKSEKSAATGASPAGQ
jgi:putative FmdB family regulatory protein